MSIHPNSHKAGPKIDESSKRQAMKTLNTNMKRELDFSTLFAFFSPVLGVLVGFLGLLLFAR